MKQEDKDLLLKDLSARLPFGVVCHYQTVVPMVGKVKSYDKLRNISFLMDRPCFQFGSNRDIFDFDNIKPYLYPMSSMTEEQKIEYNSLRDFVPTYHYEFGDIVEDTELYDNWISIDWLNAHHFDYRGLIDEGLAIDATNLNIY